MNSNAMSGVVIKIAITIHIFLSSLRNGYIRILARSGKPIMAMKKRAVSNFVII